MKIKPDFSELYNNNRRRFQNSNDQCRQSTGQTANMGHGRAGEVQNDNFNVSERIFVVSIHRSPIETDRTGTMPHNFAWAWSHLAIHRF